MIELTTFQGKRLAVFGLGKSGIATAHALTAGGAEVVCFDDDRGRVAEAWDVGGLPTGDLRVADFAAFDALVLSPGVPLTHPAPHWTVTRALAAGIPIIGDVELFDRERRARFAGLRLVAITGTNGKSTTTALLGHLLREMGEAAQVGGNIGRPVLDLDPTDGIAVVEVSSFQIDLSPTITPDVGALLNVSPDHLDRHGTFENYAAVKQRLVAQSRVAVVGRDEADAHRPELMRSIAEGFEQAGKPLFSFLTDDGTEGANRAGSGEEAASRGVENGIVACRVLEEDASGGRPQGSSAMGWRFAAYAAGHEVARDIVPEVPSLRGRHNGANAAAALAMVQALGLDVERAVAHLATFPGLPHRMEEVGRAGGVAFVNDSKATNVDSAHTALIALSDVYWIAGGRAKPGGLNGLAFDRYDVRRAYLIGEAAAAFEAELEGTVPTVRCGTLDAALDAAARDAAAAGHGIVLLSPACASFDQFRSFEERGDTFRALVAARLAGER